MFKNEIKKLRNQKRVIKTRSKGVESEDENQSNVVFQSQCRKAVLDGEAALQQAWNTGDYGLQGSQVTQGVWETALHNASPPPPWDMIVDHCNLLSGLSPTFKVLESFMVETKDHKYILKSGFPGMAVDRIHIGH